MNEAERHLAKVCKGMAKFVGKQTPFPEAFTASKDPYRALIRAVVFQQLSGKAATTIHNRVLALFPDKAHPDPEDILNAKDETLRSAGLSRQKAAALRDIAQKRLDGIIPQARALSRLPDDEIIDRLTQARGVGRWTVEMYLMFSLGRPDILPIDDLGVRKGAEKILRRTFTPKELGEYGERWGPWRSAAAWHCWRALETVTPATAK
jgi:3-methyladenine DNA glycosylase/8-oxoguanine DNA glycosylase